MRSTFSRLFTEEEGQDLLEYALLVAFVGLAVLAAFLTLQDTFSNTYTALDTNEQDLSATTPNPWD